MRTFTLGLLAAALLTAVAATPAVATPRGVNGQIAFNRPDPLIGDHAVYTINPDGGHERRLVDFSLSGPNWSPDGTRIAGCCTPLGDSHSASTIIDVDHGGVVALPKPDPANIDAYCGLWSPDGARLACETGGVSDDRRNGVYTIRASDGGGLQRLTYNPGGLDQPGDFAPDGKRLVFRRFADFALFGTPEWQAKSGLYVLNVRANTTRKVAPFFSSVGSWSPQGNEIVFSQRPNFDVHGTLWVVHSDGSDLHEIPEPICGGPVHNPDGTDNQDTHGCVDPVWSPDGTKIVFRRTTPGFGEGGDLYTINADGNGLTQVTHHGDVDIADWGTHPLATG
jgi:Tol biopolymer transport system component